VREPGPGRPPRPPPPPHVRTNAVLGRQRSVLRQAQALTVLEQGYYARDKTKPRRTRGDHPDAGAEQRIRDPDVEKAPAIAIGVKLSTPAAGCSALA